MTLRCSGRHSLGAAQPPASSLANEDGGHEREDADADTDVDAESPTAATSGTASPSTTEPHRAFVTPATPTPSTHGERRPSLILTNHHVLPVVSRPWLPRCPRTHPCPVRPNSKAMPLARAWPRQPAPPRSGHAGAPRVHRDHVASRLPECPRVHKPGHRACHGQRPNLCAVLT